MKEKEQSQTRLNHNHSTAKTNLKPIMKSNYVQPIKMEEDMLGLVLKVEQRVYYKTFETTQKYITIHLLLWAWEM